MQSINWTHEDIVAMQAYDWPGNIRELRNLMERCILLGKPPADYWQELNDDFPVSRVMDSNPNEEQSITGSDSVTSVSDERPCRCHENGQEQYCYPTDWTLKEVEKAHILQVVDSNDGNKSAAARQLGVARKTLERKFKEWTDEVEELKA